MNKVIVTTTINNPTEAIEKFDSMKDWKLVVVGDLKTPKDYKLKNGMYISPKAQELFDKDLSDMIGWNCIQRRNFGFIQAYNMGADIIATIDDDNIPGKNWGKNILIGKEVNNVSFIESEMNCIDPLTVANPITAGECILWHRGYPLKYVFNKNNFCTGRSIQDTFDIQANFWLGEPDIDAMCRMMNVDTTVIEYPNAHFNSGERIFPFATYRFSPFNSQNTLVLRKVLRDYFVFPFVGRMDDIWASYYVESCGYKVIYDEATVVQKRNVHNTQKDAEKEMIGYSNNHKLLDDILHYGPKFIKNYLPEKSWKAFQLYRKHFTEEED
jgi:hypothetical protein